MLIVRKLWYYNKCHTMLQETLLLLSLCSRARGSTEKIPDLLAARQRTLWWTPLVCFKIMLNSTQTVTETADSKDGGQRKNNCLHQNNCGRETAMRTGYDVPNPHWHPPLRRGGIRPVPQQCGWRWRWQRQEESKRAALDALPILPLLLSPSMSTLSMPLQRWCEIVPCLSIWFDYY